MKELQTFTIHQSSIRGKGCFATRNIARGELIHPFTGVHMNGVEMLDAVHRGEIRKDDPLQIGDHAYLRLEEAARCFNHSCSPNAGLRTNQSPERDGEPDLYAMTEISLGEEITYDYSTTVGLNDDNDCIDWTMRCRCGSSNCRGEITVVDSIPEQLLLKYIQGRYAMDFIIHQFMIRSGRSKGSIV